MEINSFTWLMGCDGPSFTLKEGVYVVTTPTILMKLYVHMLSLTSRMYYANVDYI